MTKRSRPSVQKRQRNVNKRSRWAKKTAKAAREREGLRCGGSRGQ